MSWLLRSGVKTVKSFEKGDGAIEGRHSKIATSQNTFGLGRTESDGSVQKDLRAAVWSLKAFIRL
jgi:hypothetical protein